MPQQIGQKQLVQIFKDVQDMGTQEPRFCFLIGAGASKSSGIPSGWELANEWYEELKGILEPADLKQWEEKQGFNEERLGEFYPQLYEKRYGSNPKVGYEKFKKIMEGKEPDLGYVILSQILAREPHNFVITTNFDYLIEDAIRQFTDTKPFVAGHETLAGFVASMRDRPTIVKVHRDLFLNPINDMAGTDRIKEEWKETLRPILKDYHLLVIGYGGNDGSLMDYLTEIGDQNREPIYWCKREGDDLNPKVMQLLGENDFEVTIDGFDELMYSLYGELKYDTFKNLGDQNHPFVQNAKERNDRLNKRLGELAERLKKKQPTERAEKDPLENLLSHEWSYVLATSKETDLDKKESLFLEGIKQFPDGANLIGNYANFQKNIRKDHNQAEEYYLKALKADPDHANNNSNYALFLTNIRKDHDQAEQYFLKALKADPDAADFNGNYALFLTDIRKDHDQAEEYYLKALKADSDDADFNGNYALFLTGIRKDHDQAEEYYLKALKADPDYANSNGNYANFLTGIRKDHDQAERYYLKALKADPDHANNNSNYALFLTDMRKDHDQAEEYYLKALKADPNHAIIHANYAHHLILWKQDFKPASTFIEKAFAFGEENQLLAELWFYRFAHYTEHRDQAEKELEQLIQEGTKSIGWNFQGHIDIAEKNGHPKLDQLKRFAKALVEED